MNVLFISDTKLADAPFRDSSTRHRCYSMAEGLHAAGHLADVATLAEVQLANLSRYDIVSVQQPSASKKLLSLVERCQKLNIRTVADLDALEFNAELPKSSIDNQSEINALASQRRRYMLQNLALKQFDEVSVATEELAKARREIEPSQPVYVVPTGLSNYWLACHDHLGLKPSQNQRIGYFPGIRGMSSEFAVAETGLGLYLQANADSELYVVGPLAISDQSIPSEQLNRGVWIDHMDLPERLSHCHASISPHQNNRVNYAQPHTSFIEAAAFGIPTISSPTAELEGHDVQGLFIADSDEQWLECLEQLDNNAIYEECQNALYNYVRTHCLAQDSATILIEQWTANNENSRNETTTDLSKAG